MELYNLSTHMLLFQGAGGGAAEEGVAGEEDGEKRQEGGEEHQEEG